jgi:membrane protein DedA with SNARE-associated domain
MDGVLGGWLPPAGQGVLLHLAVAAATLIDATGLPFPGRILLIAAGAGAGDPLRVVTLTLAGAVGALAGDHLWYFSGRLGGRRLLNVYCRLSLGSKRCQSRAREYFKRFGPLTVIIGRFVAGLLNRTSP